MADSPGRLVRGDAGVSLLIVALSITAILGITAFAVDLGYSRGSARLAQGTVDSAALAGAPELPTSAPGDAPSQALARNVAMDYAFRNLPGSGVVPASCGAADAPTCTMTLPGGGSVAVTTPYRSAVNLIHVEVCLPSETFFASAIGQSAPRVCREAVARKIQGLGTYPFGLVSTSRTACPGLEIDGGPDVYVQTSAVMVNSACVNTAAIGTSNSFLIDSPFIGVVGGDGLRETRLTSDVVQIEHFDSPFADLTVSEEPAASGIPISSTSDCAGPVLEPGRYPALCSTERNNFDFVLRPGLYYFENGFVFRGRDIRCDRSTPALSAECDSTGILLFNRSGDLEVNGGGTMDLPAYKLEPYEDYGLSIWQSSLNTREVSIAGSNGSVIGGSIFIPTARLNLGGTADWGVDPGIVVADTLRIRGNGVITVEPPSDAPPIPSVADIGLEE